MRTRPALLMALSARATGWIFILGMHIGFNSTAGDVLFGLKISFGLAWVLRLLASAAIVISLLAIIQVGLHALAARLFSEPIVRPGICKRCGYDMRASTIQCPECGYVVEKTSASSSRTRALNG